MLGQPEATAALKRLGFPVFNSRATQEVELRALSAHDDALKKKENKTLCDG
jgi:hypothetical protein